MAIAVISGNGANRKTNFANIHYGGRSFQKDTSTTHSQVQLVQQALNSAGYNCGNADGIFGEKTRTAVRNFQMDQGLSQDGKIGKNTISALENGSHLDGGVGGCDGIPFSYATLNTTYSAVVVTGGGSLIVRDAPNGTNVGTVSNGSTQLLKKYSSSVQWYQINDSTSSLDGNYVDASYVKLGSPY